MTSIEFHTAQRQIRHQLFNTLARATIRTARRVAADIATWRQRREDRAALVSLLGKEDWVFRDMGVTRGDVEWASRLPLHVNAARELDKLRQHARYGQ